MSEPKASGKHSMSEGDPFAALGLPARAGLTDDDVRAAWRRIAAATHPDRDDGGEPARFAAAAAAYETLRTSFGRGEAMADIAELATLLRRRRARPAMYGVRAVSTRALPAKLPRHAGRPARAGRSPRLVVRLLGAAAPAVVAFAAAGWSPGTLGVLVGALTWLVAVGWRERHRWRRPWSLATRGLSETCENALPVRAPSNVSCGIPGASLCDSG